MGLLVGRGRATGWAHPVVPCPRALDSRRGEPGSRGVARAPEEKGGKERAVRDGNLLQFKTVISPFCGKCSLTAGPATRAGTLFRGSPQHRQMSWEGFAGGWLLDGLHFPALCFCCCSPPSNSSGAPPQSAASRTFSWQLKIAPNCLAKRRSLSQGEQHKHPHRDPTAENCTERALPSSLMLGAETCCIQDWSPCSLKPGLSTHWSLGRRGRRHMETLALTTSWVVCFGFAPHQASPLGLICKAAWKHQRVPFEKDKRVARWAEGLACWVPPPCSCSGT